MNIRALQLLRRIVQFGSLADAASRQNLTVPTASRLLKQLEFDIGLTLFSRDHRRLELTEDGALFYAQIANTLTALEEIPKVASDIRGHTTSFLSIVTSAPLANGLAVPGLAELRRRQQDIQCTINVANRFEIESKVAARGYSMGLISLPVENAIVELEFVPFLESRPGILMRHDHPLAARDEIAPADLRGERMISLATGQRWRDRFDRIMAGLGRPVAPDYETGSTTVSIEMVRAGLGLTLMDQVCWQAGQDGLIFRPLSGTQWITYACLHSPGTRSALSDALLDAICAHYEAMIAGSPSAADALRLI